jgi:hypothetical protein
MGRYAEFACPQWAIGQSLILRKGPVCRVWLFPVVGKLLVYSIGVTLLPLLVKLATFIRYPFFLVKVPLQKLVIDILNVTKFLLVTTKSN